MNVNAKHTIGVLIREGMEALLVKKALLDLAYHHDPRRGELDQPEVDQADSLHLTDVILNECFRTDCNWKAYHLTFLPVASPASRLWASCAEETSFDGYIVPGNTTVRFDPRDLLLQRHTLTAPTLYFLDHCASTRSDFWTYLQDLQAYQEYSIVRAQVPCVECFDGWTSLAVLLGALGSLLGWPLADPLIGLLITLVILFVVKDSTVTMWRRLMDAVEPQQVEAVEREACAIAGVQDVHEGIVNLR